ncbi:MAG: AAA family ATPase, partial [Microbacterium sp.]
LALVLAVVGAFFLIAYVNGADARAQKGAQLTDVYVVKTEIPRGTSGEQIKEFVVSDTVAQRNAVPDAVTDLATLQGLIASADLLPGEQLSTARFVDPQDIAASGDVPVPEGMQLLSFTLPADRVVGGQVKPGDRIGLIGTIDPKEPEGQTEVVNPISQFAFHDVLVTRVQGLAKPAKNSTDGTAVEQESGSSIMLTIALSAKDIGALGVVHRGRVRQLRADVAHARERQDRQLRHRTGDQGECLVSTPFLLVSRSAEFEARLRELLGGRLTVVPGVFLTFGAETIAAQIDGGPKVAFLGPVFNFEETRALSGELTARFPDLAIVVVREQRSDLEDWVDELSLHAVVSPLATDDELKEFIAEVVRWLITERKATMDEFRPRAAVDTDQRKRAFAELMGVPEDADTVPTGAMIPAGSEQDADQEPVAEPDVEEIPAEPATPEWEFPPLTSDQRPEAFAVVAPKGGQGKTTISINLAAGLARIAPNSVVLVDADTQFGDISAALDLDPVATIVDATSDAAADELILKTTLTHHRDNFFVVASAPSPELGDEIRPAALARLIEQLRGIFRYVVIDTTPGLGEQTLTVIEHVTDAVFVANLGVPSLRALRTELEMLRTLGLLPANRRVVVNQSEKNIGITVKDAEQIIGAPVDVEVPRSSAVVLASNRGVPLIDDDPRDHAARAIAALVAQVAPEANARASRRQRRS